MSWLSLVSSLAGIANKLIGWLRHSAVKREGHKEAELEAYRESAKRRREREELDAEVADLDRDAAIERLRKSARSRDS